MLLHDVDGDCSYFVEQDVGLVYIREKEACVGGSGDGSFGAKYDEYVDSPLETQTALEHDSQQKL